MPKDNTTATEQAALVMSGCKALTDAMVADPKQDYPMPDFNLN